MTHDEPKEPTGPGIDWAEQLAAAWRARMCGEERTIVTRAGMSLGDVIENARRMTVPGVLGGFSRSLYLDGERRDRTIAVHAIFSDSGSLASVTVRARLYEPEPQVGATLLRAALGTHGGWQYNSLSIHGGSERAVSFEVIVYFGSVLPYLATNVIDQPRIMGAQQRLACEHVLSGLGVRFGKKGAILDPTRKQMRLPLSRTALVGAYEYALAEGLWPAVYSAHLPVTRWARIEHGCEWRSGCRVEFVDCVVGRGLSTKKGFTPKDLDELETFVQKHFDFSRSGLVWTASVPGIPRRERDLATAGGHSSTPRLPSSRPRLASAQRRGFRVIQGGVTTGEVDRGDRRE